MHFRITEIIEIIRIIEIRIIEILGRGIFFRLGTKSAWTHTQTHILAGQPVKSASGAFYP